jgi:hypothetical protein
MENDVRSPAADVFEKQAPYLFGACKAELRNAAKTRIASFTCLFNFRLSQRCARELPGKMINPTVPIPSKGKSNRLVIGGCSPIDCLSRPMRGLSGWFDQVSTEGVKKMSRASN